MCRPICWLSLCPGSTLIESALINSLNRRAGRLSFSLPQLTGSALIESLGWLVAWAAVVEEEGEVSVAVAAQAWFVLWKKKSALRLANLLSQPSGLG